jgi:hypothetical protein
VVLLGRASYDRNCCLSVLKIPHSLALLAFKISVEMSAIILMVLPLYVICFFLLQPSIFFVCSLC